MRIETRELHYYYAFNAQALEARFRNAYSADLQSAASDLASRLQALPSAGHVYRAELYLDMIRRELATR